MKEANQKNKISGIYTPVYAETHTPPYKIHKYFARRPWNVFSQIINNFSNKGEIIIDPFCGGGVTVYESLKLNRKSIGCDLNPLAIFVVNNMVKRVNNTTALDEVIALCKNYIKKLYQGYNYFIKDGKKIEIIWSELAFIVECPYCHNKIIQRNDNKLRNGVYSCNRRCPGMQKEIQGIESRYCKRINTGYLFHVGSLNGKRIIKNFEKEDFILERKHINFLKKEIINKKIKIPYDKIPLNWDRQLEDQLAKKGIITFQDFFTTKNLFINLLLLNFIKSFKSKLSKDDYELLRIIFSNTIKDTNIMSFTNDAWQSGKPTTWSKHAYWVPSQFCEVNIFDAFDKSAKRIKSSLNYNNIHGGNPIKASEVTDLKNSNANIFLWSKSITELNIEKEFADVVITDPPYGSNVQYLELSQFWYPWNKDMYDVVPNFSIEAISNRKKNFVGAKSMYEYEDNLYNVFSKSFTALKFNRHMILTFNNKDVSAWLALLFSIFKSGFTLEKNGIYFQDGVKNYKQTAHTKYNGSPYGDFIYVFKKSSVNKKNKNYFSEQDFINDLELIFSKYLKNKATNKNIIIRNMFFEAIPVIENFAKTYLLSNKHQLYSHFKKNYFDHLYA